MRQAIHKANKLNVPLIIAGDLHDSKANMRGECVNRMLREVQNCYRGIYLMIGNHCKIHEKSDEHTLNFLRRDHDENRVIIIDTPYVPFHGTPDAPNVYMFPYYSDITALKKELQAVQKGSIVIMHQGLRESSQTDMADPTAITLEDTAGLRVISGHYHRREHIANPRGGSWDFIGNPFTLTFGEADDPEKGFQILYDDGSLEFVPTNLRKHIIVDIMVGDLDHPDLRQYDYKPGDLLWLKVRGQLEYLNITRQQVAHAMAIEPNFKLDLIPMLTEFAPTTPHLSNEERFDAIIDQLDASDERKKGLKELWRKLLT